MLAELKKEKKFLLQFLKIALPIAGQNTINVAIAMADTVMIGRLGEVELAAINQANQLGFVMSLFMFGLASGSNVMIAQYWGKKDVESIQKVMTVMYRILIFVSAAFLSLAMLGSRQVMTVFSGSPEVVEAGARFLRVVCLGYAFDNFATATLLVLRSVGTVKISLLVYPASLVANVFFNWVFIFGNLGAPALGIRGGALATVLARILELVIVAVYMVFFEKIICYKARMFLQKKLGIIRTFVTFAAPVIINELLWGMGAAALVAIIGWLGTEFAAANTVCTVIGNLIMVAIMGAGSASAVVIGNTVGSGDYELARRRGKMLIFISFLLGLSAMAIVFAVKGPILRLYNISDQAKLYADQIMTILAFVVVFQAIIHVAIVGVLRGGGDGHFVALVDVLPLWLVSIPLGYLTGIVWGWPLHIVYIVLKLETVIKALFTLPRIMKGGWIKDVTKARH